MGEKKTEKKPIDIVKHQLWRNGHSAKNVSNYTNYDLLVNNKIKVKVEKAKQAKQKDNWIVNITKETIKEVDVISIIIKTVIKDNVVLYTDIANMKIGANIINKEIIKKFSTKLLIFKKLTKKNEEK